MKKIPIIDVRKGSLVDIVSTYRRQVLRLMEASVRTFGIKSQIASFVALPIADILSKKWLEKTNNPYFSEIKRYAEILGVQGVYAFNMCYEWGCTSGVYTNQHEIALMRVLDWPFPELGEHIIIAHQSGEAGDFYNATWPGVSGVFQAVAPGRFSAALNQAPMRRYKTGMVLDWIRNRGVMHRQSGLPPAHLLRKVFETAHNYQEAHEWLVQEPISAPALFTLSGMQGREGCVIERLEHMACVREIKEGHVCVANHFESYLNGIGHGWLPRAIDSHGRAKAAVSLEYQDMNGTFKWFQPPIANPLSRLVMEVQSSTGHFSVMGVNGLQQVTEISRV